MVFLTQIVVNKLFLREIYHFFLPILSVFSYVNQNKLLKYT